MNAAVGMSIEVGWQVLGSDGGRIGTVEELGPDYFEVDHGVLFRRAIFVPTAAVTGIESSAGRVHINRRSDEIDGLGWDTAPRFEPVPRVAEDSAFERAFPSAMAGRTMATSEPTGES
jgi:hypothetical protein